MSFDDDRTRNGRTPAASSRKPVTVIEDAPGRASAPPTQLGSYDLVRELGSGGMGKVYLARHRRLGREVAIKTLRPELAEDREAVSRFFQEARTVNAINHEHIVEIFDFIDEPGSPPQVYCVMELLAGQNLSRALKAGPMPLARIIDVAHQTAQALAAAHRAGVIHRDVKPANLMLTSRGGREDFVKVLDFGIAKTTSAALGGVEALSTRTGLTLGTPEYMAPEQALSKSVDARVDIYALGLTLYEMLAGRRPFEAESVAQLLVQLVTEPPAPLPGRTATGEAIPARLADLTMRCLKKRPEERPQTMDEVVSALEQIFPRGTTGAFEVKAPASAPGRPRRAGLVVAGVIGIATAVGAVRFWPRAHPPLAPVAAAPVAAPVATAASVEKPKAVESPQRPVTVALDVDSTPSGARVIRLDTGEELGITPLHTRVARAETTKLQLVKDGFAASTQEIRLDRDVSLVMALRKLAAPTHRSVRRPSGTTSKEHPIDRDAQLDPFASP